MVSEKDVLLTPQTLAVNKRQHGSKRAYMIIATSLALCGLYYLLSSSPILRTEPFQPACDQFQAIHPPNHGNQRLADNAAWVKSTAFVNQSADILSRVVQVKSASYDDMNPVGHDSRWNMFEGYQDVLPTAFPLLHAHLNLTLVNTYARLYVWQGSVSFDIDNPDSHPLVLMSHLDTVPVEPATVDLWTYPPWSGHFDGEWLWGRGSCDCKSLVVSQMTAIELLLQAGFKPKRTIILSMGIDEESAGDQGAGKLAQEIEARYGKNSVYAIVDEGGLNRIEYGQLFAGVETGEKGYLDANITLHTPGGHSSVPPVHTGIGMAASLIQSLENDPFELELTGENPFYGYLTCLAEHATDAPKPLKSLITRAQTSASLRTKLAQELVKDEATNMKSRAMRFLMSTSQAIDIIKGGFKANALPEQVSILVNYRISVASSVKYVKHRLTKIAKAEAEKSGLGLVAFGKQVMDATDNGWIALGGEESQLEPAPISPLDAPSWEQLVGVIRGVFDGITVSPMIDTGNTDTKSYWNLTKNIYRYSPAECEGIHTVDERVKMTSHAQVVWLFHQLMRVMAG